MTSSTAGLPSRLRALVPTPTPDLREHLPGAIVSALGSSFGVSLLLGTDALSKIISANDRLASSGQIQYVLTFIAAVFITIALYVAAIVSANTTSTIVAGRTRLIALLRLLGATAARQRRAVAAESVVVGAVGAVAGGVLGSGFVAILLTISTSTGAIPDIRYSYLRPETVLVVVVVVLTGWAAAWAGSRRVLAVSPMQAIGASETASFEVIAAQKARTAVAIALIVVGGLVLASAVVVGFVSSIGVLIGVVGGVLSFTGVVLAAHVAMPPVLRVAGRMLSRGPAARLAAENAVRYPERTARTTIGLVIGITLVTMFAVAVDSFRATIAAAEAAQPGLTGLGRELDVVVVVFSVLIGYSALIAAVGMINNASLSVMQRTRELALLRTLGFTARQVRVLILVECAQGSVAAVIAGISLGVVYGWVGAQSLLGSLRGSPELVPPGIPVLVVAGIILAAVVLTVAASVAPSRRATRLSPIAALATE